MSKRAIAALAAAAALASATGGCGGGESKGPRGAPVLDKMFWRVGPERFVVWSRTTDRNLKASVPPNPLEWDLTFGGRLDGHKIEDIVTVDGGTTTRAKEMPPITVTWPGSEAVGAERFRMTVAYNSLPLAGAGSGNVYVFGRAMPSYPSQTTLTFHLDSAGLTSAYNEVMEGPSTIEVITEPFLVAIATPAPCPSGAPRPVGTDFELPLAFNNRPLENLDVVRGFIHASAGEGVLPFRLVADARNPATLYVAPAGAAGAPARWPAGSRVTVTVNQGLPDIFEIGLASTTTGAFTTLAAGDDGSRRCPPAPDGGPDASDGGIAEVSDAPVADAADAGAPDSADSIDDSVDAPDSDPLAPEGGEG